MLFVLMTSWSRK